jgi:phosphoglycolate phosphatase
MIRNFILDWSGTLADDFKPVLATTNLILQHYGRPALSREGFRDVFRLPYTEFYHDMLPEVPLTELQALYLKHFPADSGSVELIEHALEFLEYAAATGRRMVLLSSVPLAHFEAQAAATGVRSFFDGVHCGVVDKRLGILSLLEEFGMKASETAFIGDMRHDVDAAKGAGVLSVATVTGYESAEKLLESAPDVLVPNLAVLPRFMGGWHARVEEHPIATVGALILDAEGKLLVVKTHKWSHRWGIPGGKIKRGESSLEALRREIMEETALELEDIRFVMVQDCVEPPEFLRSAHFLLLNYVARCAHAHPAVRLNDEAEEFRWVTPQEVIDYDLNEPTRILLNEVMLRGMLRAT